VLILVCISIWGIQWATNARPPLPEAIEALESDDLVTIAHEPWLTFTPAEDSLTIGFTFYHSGRVDPRVYASLAQTITEDWLRKQLELQRRVGNQWLKCKHVS